MVEAPEEDEDDDGRGGGGAVEIECAPFEVISVRAAVLLRPLSDAPGLLGGLKASDPP